MAKVIYFNENCFEECCVPNFYNAFLEYAFGKTDFFMLVFVDYYGEGLNPRQLHFKELLAPYAIMTRTNPNWPGTPKTFSFNTSYEIVFYRNNLEVIDVLKEVSSFYDWKRPDNAQDLAFFKGNQCWFYSVAHEKIASIVCADQEDMNFLECQGVQFVVSDVGETDEIVTMYNEQELSTFMQ